MIRGRSDDLESLLIPARSCTGERADPFGSSYLENPEKREVPSLINSIRHGLLRARAPILCYAF